MYHHDKFMFKFSLILLDIGILTLIFIFIEFVDSKTQKDCNSFEKFVLFWILMPFLAGP